MADNIQLWPQYGWGPWPLRQEPIAEPTPSVAVDEDLPPVPAVAYGVEVIDRPYVSVGRVPAADVAVSSDTPNRPVVVAAVEPPRALPFVYSSEPLGVAVTPIASVVAEAVELPRTLPFVFVGSSRAEPPPPPPQVPIKPTVVNAQPLPPPDVDQVILFTVVSQGLPSRATVVDAEPLPLSKPFVFIGSSKAEPPAAAPQVPVRPTVVSAQPAPPQAGQSRIAHGFADATPPADPQVPIRPTVVGAQPVPTQTGQAWVSRGFADALTASATPPKPVIVAAQPYPPQAPFVSTPRGGRWGDPPPRIIQPTVVTDLSLPFRPTGWHRVAHGFAEALPLLGDGGITGGTPANFGMVGVAWTGVGVYGVARVGAVTGGAYSSPSAEGKAYSEGNYSDGVYEGYEGFASQPVMTGQIQSGYMGGGRR